MKSMLLFLACLASCAEVPPEWLDTHFELATDVRLAPPVATAVPDERPLAAVVLTSCNGLIVALVQMPDGTTMVFDHDSPVPAEEAIAFADTARQRPLRYEFGCPPEPAENKAEQQTI